MTKEEVEMLIKQNDDKLRQDLNTLITSDGEALRAEMTAHRQEIFTHRATFVDQESRINQIIDGQNAKNETIVGEITNQQAVLTQQHQQARQALDETQNLDGRLKDLTERLTKLGQDAKEAIDNVDIEAKKTRADTIAEFELVKRDIMKWFEAFKAQQSDGPPGLNDGKGNRGKGIDKKDIAVWKLPEDLDKQAFRHWLDAVDQQLELVHGFRHAGFVMNEIRRSNLEIAESAFEECIGMANNKITASLASMGVPYSSANTVDTYADYVFLEKTTFLNSYLICKLNTDLHGKTFGLESKNGFELYRQICQLVDAVPENAAFHMNNDLGALTKLHGNKVVDLRTLYGFRLLLKRKIAEYKKVIGTNPDEVSSMQILWNAMDPDSKTKAMSEGIDKKKYKDLYEHIDMRYKIMYGHLDYKSSSKDDPMGLALIGHAEQEPQPKPTKHEPNIDSPGMRNDDGYENAHLDALKGKGKGKGDGSCHTCGGQGHYARECPSTPPISPTSQECHGCGGRGHLKHQCPTANPHLKGWGKGKSGGKGKGWSDGKGWGKSGGKGKGWGKNGNKGKGKGGKGAYSLDLMGSGAAGGDEGWGAEAQWPADQWGGQGEWDNSLRSIEAKYGRALAALGPAPVKVSNTFDPITEASPDSFEVPISDFIRNKKQRQVVKTRRIKKQFIKSDCGCCEGEECGREVPQVGEVRRELSPAWARHEAKQENHEYENGEFTFYEHETNDNGNDEKLDWDSEVEVSDMEPFPQAELEAQYEDSEAEVSDLEQFPQAELEAQHEDSDASMGSWRKAPTGRRGGKRETTHSSASATFKTKCRCERRSSTEFCESGKCRNDNPRVRPIGSTTIGRVGTDDGSQRSTIKSTRSKVATPQPKPSDQRKQKNVQDIGELIQKLQNAVNKADSSNSGVILDALRRAGDVMTSNQNCDYWVTEEGQAALVKKIGERAKGPTSLSVFDYSDETKAMLSSAGAANQEEWIEVELCADTGACDTVMPRKMCQSIPVQPSLQSIKCMEYEVADGNTIPNLGERRCIMWTDGATEGRRINLQVADVHKPLLSLSRCADMGFESRFGRIAGALIDEVTKEVIPLERKGNLYVLKCWLKAAPFGRQGVQ